MPVDYYGMRSRTHLWIWAFSDPLAYLYDPTGLKICKGYQEQSQSQKANHWQLVPISTHLKHFGFSSRDYPVLPRN